MSALAQERLKDLAPNRPRDRSPDGAHKGLKNQPSKPSKRHPDDRAKALPGRPNLPKPSDDLRLFGEAVAELERSYVVKVDQRKLVEAAIRGMFKAFDAKSGYVETPESPDHTKSAKDFDALQVFREAVAALDKNLAVKPDRLKVTEAAIRGMLKHLDAQSEYLDRQEIIQLLGRPRSELGGIGLHFRMDGGRVKVVVPGAPAEREGLGTGDVITHIDGKDLGDFTVGEVHRLLAGPPGSTVLLKVVPDGRAQPREVELRREIIRNAPSVQSSVELDVGYIRIFAFREDTDTELTNAVQRLKREIAGNLKGYVIDLRNNTGGLLNQAIRSADVFLDSGLIVELRGREQSDRRNALPGDAARGLPLAVLVNGGTAAGAETMAAALQDHKRALLVGSRTAGSGTVQTVLVFGRPKAGAMKLTTHHQHTPLGRVLEGVGIEPDVAVARAGHDGSAGFVPPDKSRDAQLQRALSLLRDGT
jgi:carboxyl-terminal processing protease